MSLNKNIDIMPHVYATVFTECPAKKVPVISVSKLFRALCANHVLGAIFRKKLYNAFLSNFHRTQ